MYLKDGGFADPSARVKQRQPHLIRLRTPWFYSLAFSQIGQRRELRSHAEKPGLVTTVKLGNPQLLMTAPRLQTLLWRANDSNLANGEIVDRQLTSRLEFNTCTPPPLHPSTPPDWHLTLMTRILVGVFLSIHST